MIKPADKEIKSQEMYKFRAVGNYLNYQTWIWDKFNSFLERNTEKVRKSPDLESGMVYK